MKGFYVRDTLWQSHEVRSLSVFQRGVLIEIYSILSEEKDKKWWGFLTISREIRKPISDRRLREFIGGDSILGLSSWNAAKEAFEKNNHLIQVEISKLKFLYSPSFVKFNPYDMTKKQTPTEAQPRLRAADFLLGYDPDKKIEDDELDTWGRICRKWLELSGGKMPFGVEVSMSAKEDLKNMLVESAESMGVENALHDMVGVFEIKGARGERINALNYMIVRWRAGDWTRRFNGPAEEPEDEESKDFKRLERETRILMERGTIRNRENFFAYYPGEEHDVLEEVAEALGL